ncbi:hypothetical protein ABZP36_004565 [Zizania latifolia]
MKEWRESWKARSTVEKAKIRTRKGALGEEISDETVPGMTMCHARIGFGAGEGETRSGETGEEQPKLGQCFPDLVSSIPPPAAMADRTATFVDLIIAIILPPLGVFLKVGCEVGAPRPRLCKSACTYVGGELASRLTRRRASLPLLQIEFWICLVLSFFGYLPGIIYAVWVIVKD